MSTILPFLIVSLSGVMMRGEGIRHQVIKNYEIGRRKKRIMIKA
jgi:hypothetical protein